MTYVEIRNARHVARYRRLERLVRRIRQRIFDYYDADEAQGQKASRVLRRALNILREYDQWWFPGARP